MSVRIYYNFFNIPSTYEDAVKGARTPASLCVAQCRNPCVKSKAICKYLLDIFRANWLKFCVMGTLCNDDDGLAFSNLAVLENKCAEYVLLIRETSKHLLDSRTHFVLPWVTNGWSLRNEDEIGTGSTRTSTQCHGTVT